MHLGKVALAVAAAVGLTATLDPGREDPQPRRWVATRRYNQGKLNRSQHWRPARTYQEARNASPSVRPVR